MKTNIGNPPLPYPEKDERNCYSIHNKYYKDDRNLSECNYNIENFNHFIKLAKTEALKGDSRPVFVFDFFERLNDAIDITPFLEELASLDRSVFICVPPSYPAERITKKVGA